MIKIEARNVQEAYFLGYQIIHGQGFREETRNGPALVVQEPVVTEYARPVERVILDPGRDANPFFHLMESIWMLAGRDDVASLDPYLGNLKKYSDDGVIYNGAYGRRWRHYFGYDQLAKVMELLRTNPRDRRIVLQMWSAVNDLGGSSLDHPCNTQVYFRTRMSDNRDERLALDMTIMCRSNDAIWGAHGANAVHFSVLQEFVAAMCGLQLGTMYQWSNNYHAYMDALARLKKPDYTESKLYDCGPIRPTPLFQSCPTMAIRSEAFKCIEDVWAGLMENDTTAELFTPEGIETINMMRAAHGHFKRKDHDHALSVARDIPGSDWRRASVQWLERRGRSAPSRQE